MRHMTARFSQPFHCRELPRRMLWRPDVTSFHRCGRSAEDLARSVQTCVPESSACMLASTEESRPVDEKPSSPLDPRNVARHRPRVGVHNRLPERPYNIEAASSLGCTSSCRAFGMTWVARQSLSHCASPRGTGFSPGRGQSNSQELRWDPLLSFGCSAARRCLGKVFYEQR
jgi:hypothetical protein